MPNPRDPDSWPADYKPVFTLDRDCDCGASIPMHLFEVMGKTTVPYEHHCGCGQVWVNDRGRVEKKE